MKIKTPLLISAAFGALVLAASLVSAETTTKSETSDTAELTTETSPAIVKVDQASIVPKSDEDKAKGVEVWENIYQVLSHPRCVNCHVADDRPR